MSQAEISASPRCRKGKPLSPPCGNVGEVRNLVQFVNSASNDIKDAIDKSSLESTEFWTDGSPRLAASSSSLSSSSSSFTQTSEYFRDGDKRRSYFHSRDSIAANPLKVLKVEPLNKIKLVGKSSNGVLLSDVSTEEGNSCQSDNAAREKCLDIQTPRKRVKLSPERHVDNSKDGSVPRKTVSKPSRPTQSERCRITNDIHLKNSTTTTRPTTGTTADDSKLDSRANPLPLRKRRLPASFWQEPGKGENLRPAKTVETSSPSRHTAFMPYSFRHSPLFGRYVKDFLCSNLSASEKLELLRLNSLERDHYNHLCRSTLRDVPGRGRPSSPCVFMHCKNRHDHANSVRDVPGGATFYPRNEGFFNPLHLPYPPTRNPAFSTHHERFANVLGMSYPGAVGAPLYPDVFRHDDAIDSSYRSGIIFPMEQQQPAGPPLFPLASQYHPSVVRPVPKKHLTNTICRQFNPDFDVR